MILGHLSVEALKRMDPEERLRTVAREVMKLSPRQRKTAARALWGKQGAAMLLAMAEDR